MNLYKTFVRSQLEHAVQLWNPWRQKDIDLLEKVQKRAVRMIPGLTGDYESKLREIGLLSFKKRRERGDAIQTFKILQGMDHVNYETWFHFESEVNFYSSRSVAESKLAVPRVQTESRRNFYSVRSCRLWNSIPVAVRQNVSVHYFKINYNLFYLAEHETLPLLHE